MLWLICDNAQGEIGFIYSSFYLEMSNASTARMRYFYKLNETLTDVYKIVHEMLANKHVVEHCNFDKL